MACTLIVFALAFPQTALSAAMAATSESPCPPEVEAPCVVDRPAASDGGGLVVMGADGVALLAEDGDGEAAVVTLGAWGNRRWEISGDGALTIHGGIADTYASYDGQYYVTGVDELQAEGLAYAGDPLVSNPTTAIGCESLDPGNDYESYRADSVSADTATLTVAGEGFAGTETDAFQISKIAQTVSAKDVIVAMGKTAKVSATASGGGGISYESSDESVAIVGADGTVTPRSVGTATVTVSAAETRNHAAATKTVAVKVTKGVQAIAASNKSVTATKTVKLGAKASGGGRLTYKSSDAAVATVSANGVVTGKKAGTAKITITAAETANWKGATKTVAVKVTKAANTLSAKARKATVAASLKVLKGKAVTLASNVAVSNARGAVAYANASTNATAKRFKVNAKTGKLTVPKGTKKGAYQVKVRVTAKGTAAYKSGSKIVSFKVKVA